MALGVRKGDIRGDGQVTVGEKDRWHEGDEHITSGGWTDEIRGDGQMTLGE